MDELVTFLLATDPSLPHALTALSHGADGGGPLPFVLAWAVGQVAPPGEWTFRLLSVGYVTVGLIALYHVLRGAWETRPAMVAVGWTACGSTLVLYQNSEFRFYALLFGLTALGIGCYARWFAGEGRGLWQNALVHAALALTHPFGLLYSGVFTAAALVAGRRLRARVWPLALSGTAGAAVFALWLPAFLRQSKVLTGNLQLPRPGATDLARVYGQLAPSVYYDQETKDLALRMLHVLTLPARVGLVLGVLAAAGLVARLFMCRSQPPAVTARAAALPAVLQLRRALLVLAVALVVAPLGGWVLARVGRPVFLHRYFIPSVTGFTILYAAGLAAFGRRWASGLAGRAALGAAGSLLAGWPLVSAVRLSDGYAALRERLAQFELAGRDVLPLVCDSPSSYWPKRRYDGHDNRVWLVLDRELAFAPDAGPVAATEFNFSTVQATFYPDLHIADVPKFLCNHPCFLVDDERQPWFQRHILATPERCKVEHPDGLPEHAALVTTIAPLNP